MSITLRQYRKDDADALAKIAQRAIKDIASNFYGAEQIDAWVGRMPDGDGLRQRYADERFVLVAVTEEGAPIAFGDVMTTGHVDMLYCHPDFAGQGVVSNLYDALEVEARRQSLKVLRVDASESAKPLFESRGFSVVRRNDLKIKSVAIQNYTMEKELV